MSSPKPKRRRASLASIQRLSESTAGEIEVLQLAVVDARAVLSALRGSIEKMREDIQKATERSEQALTWASRAADNAEASKAEAILARRRINILRDHLISDFFPKPGDVVAVKEQHLREYPVNTLFRVERADSFGWVTSESGHTFKKERLRKATEYEITAFNTKEHNERH